MSRRRRRHFRSGAGTSIRRRSAARGGSRWGISLADAVPGAMLEFVGTALRAQLEKYPNLPALIREAPTSALGLYALGVAFNRESWRSLGAGQILGRMLGVLKAA